MTSFIRGGFVLMCALVVTGCQQPPLDVQVTVKGADRIVAVATGGGSLFEIRKVPCVWRVSLYADDGSNGAPVWEIRPAKPDQCVDVARFVVGSTPPGFAPSVAFTRRPGRYRLDIEGDGDGTAVIDL